MSSPADDQRGPNHEFARKIRSFVRREGRMSARQKQALADHFPTYGLEYSPTTIGLDTLFTRNVDKVLEIGFGMGTSLLSMAKDNPGKDYLGIEVHRPGVGSLLADIEHNNITNIRIISHDAVEVLQNCIVDQSFSEVNIFFPDPWRKKKHHKRRLIQSEFIELLARKMLPNAKLHIATDWQNYAGWIDDIMQKQNDFEIDVNAVNYRPPTKFEQRGVKLGHDIWDKIYRRAESPIKQA